MKQLSAKLRQITKHPIYRVLFYVLSVSSAGIMGNRADAIFIYFVQQIRPNLLPSNWMSFIPPLIIAIPVAIAFAAVTSLPLTMVILKLRKSLKKSEGFIEFDNSIFKVLQLSGYSNEQQETFARLIDEMLKEALDFFGKDSSILVYRVDNSLEPDFLYLWCAKGFTSPIPTESRKIYINKSSTGKNSQKDTIIRSYIDGKVYAIDDESNETKDTQDQTKTLSTGSSISYPILALGHEQNSDKYKALGVMTLHRHRRNNFKEADVEVTRKIAERLAAVMLIATHY